MAPEPFTPARALAFALVMATASITVATVSAQVTPVEVKAADEPEVSVVRALIRWDSGWYGDIAENGYRFTPNQQSPVAYFPLYPGVIHLLAVLGLNRWLGGIFVSLLAGLSAVLLFHRWARRVEAQMALAAANGAQGPLADTAFLLLIVYPISIYLFGIMYSDALYLLCAVSAFLCLEKDRPVLAALFGALGTACRPIAPALVLGLLVRSLERRRAAGAKWRVLDVVPALAGLGLLSYMVFLWARFDDPVAFAHVQGAPGWDQAPGWHTWLKLEWFHVMFPRVAPLVAIRLGGHALLTLIALLLVWPTFKRLGWGYGVYCALAVGLPALSTKDFMGLGRYLIAAFPLFLTAASLLRERPRAARGLIALSASVFVLLAWAWGAGGYVS